MLNPENVRFLRGNSTMIQQMLQLTIWQIEAVVINSWLDLLDRMAKIAPLK